MKVLENHEGTGSALTGGEVLLEANTPAEGVVPEGRESEGGATIRASGESFNPGVSKNIEGSSQRTKTSYGAAATKVDEGVGFIPVKDQLTANLPIKLSSGATSTNPNPDTDVNSLEPLQFRANFPSPLDNNNDGDHKSKTYHKAGNSKKCSGN